MPINPIIFLCMLFVSLSLHGQGFIEQYEAYMVRSMSNATPKRAEAYPGAPGHGYPGKILPYTASPELAANMVKYNLTAGWFVRDPVTTNFTESIAIRYFMDSYKEPYPDRISFLKYTPERREGRIQQEPVPLLAFIYIFSISRAADFQ
jgi:hypothetical protein